MSRKTRQAPQRMTTQNSAVANGSQGDTRPADHIGFSLWSAGGCRLGKGPSRGDAGSSRAALAPQRIGGGGFVGSIVLQTWSGCPALQAARFRRGRDTAGGVPVPPPTVMPVPPLPTSTGPVITPDRHS